MGAIVVTTAKVKQVEQKLVDEIAKVSGEVISLKANQARVNRKVDEELARVEELSDDRFTQSKDARGKLRQIMDDNKAAATAETALEQPPADCDELREKFRKKSPAKILLSTLCRTQVWELVVLLAADRKARGARLAQEVFDAADVNTDGVLSKKELKGFLISHNKIAQLLYIFPLGPGKWKPVFHMIYSWDGCKGDACNIGDGTGCCNVTNRNNQIDREEWTQYVLS